MITSQFIVTPGFETANKNLRELCGTDRKLYELEETSGLLGVELLDINNEPTVIVFCDACSREGLNETPDRDTIEDRISGVISRAWYGAGYSYADRNPKINIYRVDIPKDRVPILECPIPEEIIDLIQRARYSSTYGVAGEISALLNPEFVESVREVLRELDSTDNDKILSELMSISKVDYERLEFSQKPTSMAEADRVNALIYILNSSKILGRRMDKKHSQLMNASCNLFSHRPGSTDSSIILRQLSGELTAFSQQSVKTLQYFRSYLCDMFSTSSYTLSEILALQSHFYFYMLIAPRDIRENLISNVLKGDPRSIAEQRLLLESLRLLIIEEICRQAIYQKDEVSGLEK